MSIFFQQADIKKVARSACHLLVGDNQLIL